VTDGPAAGADPPKTEPLGVVVVSIEQSRLNQYRAALRMAGVNALLTPDADEAEGWLRERLPASLVLDQGLPRMTVFRLYGLVRAEESMRGISVLFVGQEGQGGAEDHYLPADASPLVVAAQAQQLAARHTATAAAESETASPGAPDAGAEPRGSTDVVTEPPRDRWTPPIRPVVDADAVPVVPTRRGASLVDEPADDAVEEEASAPKRGRRLDVILFRVGIVLLILGLAAVWLNPIPANPVNAPPTAVPATPSRPPASPSPAALAAPSAHVDQASANSR
jgi:hypothetical protein